MSLRICVLISGRGSNLDAILREVHAREDVAGAVNHVVSNRPNAGGLAVAHAADIPTSVVDHTKFTDRAQFDAALAEEIDARQPDLLVLAGFMRILTDEFVTRFSPRMLNVHPSLLPDFPGLHTHRRALERGDPLAGCSVHIVIPELDAGPVLAQAAVEVKKGDNEEALATRVQRAEHLLYPEVIRWVAEGRMQLDRRRPLFDAHTLPARGIALRLAEHRLESWAREQE